MNQSLTLTTPIDKLYMVGDSYAKKLGRLDLKTVGDLLHHYPFRYEDFCLISDIKSLQPGEKATIVGQVTQFKNIYTRWGKKIQTGQINDKTGGIKVIFFNQPYLTSVFKIGSVMALSGLVEHDKNQLILKSPEYEIIKPGQNKNNLVHGGRLVPIYPETAGVSSKWLRSRIYPLLHKNLIQIKDWLPEEIKKNNKLIGLDQALRAIHFPLNQQEVVLARARLGFDELFGLQLVGLWRRQQWQQGTKAHPLKPFTAKVKTFINTFPFPLTSDQQQAIKTISSDLSSTIPTNRLIQGDVGAGKTIVAATAIYQTFLNHQISLLMAPTAILAQQHYTSLSKLFADTGMKISLITASVKTINPGSELIIGTHVLLYRSSLPAPALVVIDEQHRFGVAQRSQLLSYQVRPHLLTMSATPIPRTLTLALYSDLDLSLIKQMPKGRKNIKTWVVPINKRVAAYKWIGQQVQQNHARVFIICPLIEESEHDKMKDVKAVTKEFKALKKVFPKLRLALLHGRIKTSKKNKIMADFKKGKYDILVSTPVVEVGIDIPRATIILIEGAERFGLAQLHQLRGRVGRGQKQSYCLLFTSTKDKQENKRLKAMENHFSGFDLSEIDLKLRGPGELFGTRQSGWQNLKIASLSDEKTLVKAKAAAKKAISKLNKFPLLHEKIKNLTITDVKPN